MHRRACEHGHPRAVREVSRSLEAFANAGYEEVGEAIKSCGFYNTKSKDLVECAKILLEKYGGRVPGTMEELTSLPGIGRKTANLILGDISPPARLRLRHALHPHHGPSRSHRWQ